MAIIAERQVMEERRSRVRTDRAWLSPLDPSTNHNLASRAQHKGTSTWFIKGNLSKEWKSKLTTSLLWIHGKRASAVLFMFSQILIAWNHFSGLGKERPLVRYHFSSARLKSLRRQLALQSSKT